MYLIELDFVNEVYLKITCQSDAFTFISNHFKYYSEGYKFHPKYRHKPRLWDGKTSLVSYKDRLIGVGLLPELYSLCKKYNHTLKYNFDINLLKGKYKEDYVDKFLEKVYEKYPTEFKLLDYQIEAIKKSIIAKRLIAELPTSSRKSGIIYHLALFYRFINNPTIIVVPTVNLVEQLFTNFKEYGWYDVDNYCTRLHASTKPDFSKIILITTYQSLESKSSEFFKRYKSIIVDECQSVKTKSLKSILSKCVNAENRIGLSGTIPKEPINRYTIYSLLGPCGIRRKTKDLQDLGIISNIKIQNIVLKYPVEFIKANRNRTFQEEVKEVISYPERNKVLDYIIGSLHQDENLLVLCQFRSHFNDIKEYLEENFGHKYTIKLINGLVKGSEREHIRVSMKDETNVILLGSFQTISEGFSCDRIHAAAYLSSYKSEIKILQSIGRILRKHPSKPSATLYDVCDSLVYKTSKGNIIENNLYKHWLKRIEYYEEQKFPYETMEIKL